MIALARSLPVLLRASLLVLLVVGVIVRPMLNQISELHSVEHAVLADVAAHGHDHDGHGHDHPAEHPGDQPGDDLGDRSPDQLPCTDLDHAKGAHGLMHQADTGPSASLAGLPAQFGHPMRAGKLLMPAAGPLPPQIPSSPFRPPIA